CASPPRGSTWCGVASARPLPRPPGANPPRTAPPPPGVVGSGGAGSGGFSPLGCPAPASPVRTAACCPFLLPGRAVCPALGTGGRWTPWHANRPPGASGGANEVGPFWIRLPAVAGSGAGLVGGRLRLGVGHASTVRPDPSTLGVVGERGSHHEDCSQPVPGARSGLDLDPPGWPWRDAGWLANGLVGEDVEAEAVAARCQ